MLLKLQPNFGARLKQERSRLKLTQQAFAENAGVKRVTQYLYENEDGSPNYRYIKAIADLGVDIHYLFFGIKGEGTSWRLQPSILRSIYCIVDEIARDEKGDLLSLEQRLELFSILSARYSDSDAQTIDIDSAKSILNSSAS